MPTPAWRRLVAEAILIFASVFVAIALEGMWPGRSDDLNPDGDRFLLIDTPRDRTADRILLIKNWVHQLDAQVPGN